LLCHVDSVKNICHALNVEENGLVN
jgi:hypothetical protein